MCVWYTVLFLHMDIKTHELHICFFRSHAYILMTENECACGCTSRVLLNMLFFFFTENLRRCQIRVINCLLGSLINRHTCQSKSNYTCFTVIARTVSKVLHRGTRAENGKKINMPVHASYHLATFGNFSIRMYTFH